MCVSSLGRNPKKQTHMYIKKKIQRKTENSKAGLEWNFGVLWIGGKLAKADHYFEAFG